MEKKEKQILNKILGDRRTCLWYIDAHGDFCFHVKHRRNSGNYITWGLCERVCNDFESFNSKTITKRINYLKKEMKRKAQL